MKIAFMGKGGSGKTTITTSFIKYLLKNRPNNQKLIFDVDINSHLYNEFGIKKNEINFFAGKFDDIFDIMEPNFLKNYNIDIKPAFGTLPINKYTNFIKGNYENHPLIKKYSYLLDKNTFLFTLGNYTTKNTQIGECYHSLLNSYELILHRIIDDKNSYIIADTTAGIDNLGTSLCIGYDLSIFVLEPTERSISVYLDYINTAGVNSDNVLIIGNKIEDESDKEFLIKNVGIEKIIGFAYFDKNVNRDEGEDRYEEFIEKNIKLFENILHKLDNSKKDWVKYYQDVHIFFKNECAGWFSSYYNQDLENILTLDNNLISNINSGE